MKEDQKVLREIVDRAFKQWQKSLREIYFANGGLTEIQT